MNNEYKKLIKNVGLMTISNFGSKILNILLVPLYTSILTTSEYGTYDIYATMASLALPIITCNIADAVFRFSMDDTKDKSSVFTIGMVICIRASVIFSVITVLIFKMGLFLDVIAYPFILIGYFILHMLYEFMIRFMRGLERVRDIAIGGIINTICLLGFSLLFLLKLRMGLQGYFYAIFIAYLIPILFYSIETKIWCYFVLPRNKVLEHEMKTYSFPLIFDSIAWWINNASDRYIITWICGISVNGIYSVAYKVPSLINLIQNIFNQAWMISAIDEYKKGNTAFFKKIYSLYNFMLVFSGSIIICFDKFIAKILFAKGFYVAWKYAPFLIIAVVFGGLSSFTEGIFAASKDTKILARSTMIGAVINVFLNLILIYKYGAIGAAIATAVSYFVVWGMRVLSLKEIDFSIVKARDIFGYILVSIQAILLCYAQTSPIALSAITILIGLLFIKEFKELCIRMIDMIPKMKK